MNKQTVLQNCIILLQLLFVSIPVFSRTVIKENHAATFSLYQVVEITFTVTAPPVQNPFTDVTIAAVYNTPNGDTAHIKGFCDSSTGLVHRVRFTPSMAGNYTYQITFTDPDGSVNFSGQFNVTSTGSKNGFISADPSFPGSFMFANGGHPFICSKTAWLIGAIPEATYKGFLDKMVPRKENVIRFGLEFDYSTETPFIDVWPFGGTRSNPDYTKFNINAWRQFEQVIQYAADRNIYSECVLFTSLRTSLSWTHTTRYLDYIIARLACYPSVILFQINNEYNSTIDSKTYIKTVADYLHEKDPFNHLVAPAHRSTEDAAWADENWVDVAINHWAKSDRHSLQDIYRIANTITQYNMPAWCDETAREGRHTNNCGIHRRKQYWTWNMAGVFWSYHSLEGCEGILDLTYNGPGSEYLQFIRPFWEKTEFWKMKVDNGLIKNNPGSLYERCFASANEIVIYMVNGPDNTLSSSTIPDNITNSGIIQVDLPAGIFTCEFYNPSNGSYFTENKVTGLNGGQTVSLTFPTFNQDLVIYIYKTAEGQQPVSNFSALPVSGYAPLTVQFTSLTENATSREWNFGDNTPVSTLENPQHTFTNTGVYTVSLKAINAYGEDTETRLNYITVSEMQPPVIQSAELTGTHQLILTWNTDAGVSSYNVYKSTSPVFIPDKTDGSNRAASNVTDQNTQKAGVQWTDTGNVTGNPLVNYFYKITAVHAGIESDASAAFGEFDFTLIANAAPKTSFNEIALPLDYIEAGTASSLMPLVPFCNSIAKWDASLQNYYQYVPGFASSNFDIEKGSSCFVNVTQNGVFTITGPVAAPAFNLITTNTTSFNSITMPFSKENLTKASQLQLDVPNCNSIAAWHADIQGYYQYVPGLTFTDFDIRAGYPYYVNVTANSTWPEESLSKENVKATVYNAMTQVQSPHVVYCKLNGKQYAGFTAYIKDNSGEALDQNSPGSILNNDYVVVQTAAFTQGWKPGQVLIVELLDANGQTAGTIKETLSNNAFDDAGSLQTANVPTSFSMTQNYPNPFNPETLIRYQLPTEAHVLIRIYNINGQLVKTLVDIKQQSGYFSVKWNGRDENNNPVTSGAYFYEMTAGDYQNVLKALLIK